VGSKDHLVTSVKCGQERPLADYNVGRKEHLLTIMCGQERPLLTIMCGQERPLAYCNVRVVKTTY
jgi:hypothetical protein